MSDLLSENEIEALMKDADGANPHPSPEMNDEDFELYDLTSGMHRIQGWAEYVDIVDDRIKASLSVKLLGVLHKSVDVKREEIQIQKFEEYIKTLSLPTSINCFALSGMLGLSSIVIDSSLVSALVNALFGGGSRQTQLAGREFSHTEQRLINLIVNIIIDSIRECFKEIADMELTVVETEMNPAHFAVYSDSDVLMIRPFNIEFSGVGGNIQLIMPGSVVDAIFTHKRSRLVKNNITSEQALSVMSRNFMLEISGELKGSTLTLKDILGLSEGDVISISNPDQVDVKINGVPKYKARMGEANGNVGLEILQVGLRPGGF